MSFNTVFLIFFAAFIVILLAGGRVTRKWVTGSNEYFILQDGGLLGLNDYLKMSNYDSLKASAIQSKLVKQGYLKEFGLWRRKVALSTIGAEVVNKYQMPETNIT